MIFNEPWQMPASDSSFEYEWDRNVVLEPEIEEASELTEVRKRIEGTELRLGRIERGWKRTSSMLEQLFSRRARVMGNQGRCCPTCGRSQYSSQSSQIQSPSALAESISSDLKDFVDTEMEGFKEELVDQLASELEELGAEVRTTRDGREGSYRSKGLMTCRFKAIGRNSIARVYNHELRELDARYMPLVDQLGRPIQWLPTTGRELMELDGKNHNVFLEFDFQLLTRILARQAERLLNRIEECFPEQVERDFVGAKTGLRLWMGAARV